MNSIMESLYHRKSVRVYEDRPVSDELKNEIIDAAMQAPSAGCQQLYTILDITDQNLKDALAVAKGMSTVKEISGMIRVA